MLYFYPKDDTPGCTKEACGFQAHRAAFEAEAAEVLGVSRDSLTSHQRFAGKFGLRFPLLSDPDADVSKAYGAFKQKSMFGRAYWGIARMTVVIDEQGNIAKVFPNVRVDGHTEEILEALRAISGARPETAGEGISRSAPRKTARP